MIAKLLREARDSDVWKFVSPEEVAEVLPRISRLLGRRQDFWNFLVEGWRQDGLVDLMLDRAAPVHSDKPKIGKIRIDPADEILVNKLCDLVKRAEIRDLVDVMALEETGLQVEDALEAALAKDGGCTPASLAWVLSQIRLSEGSRLPGDVDPATLTDWLDGLVKRLCRAALPRN